MSPVVGASVWSSGQEACSLSFARNCGCTVAAPEYAGAGPASGERENQVKRNSDWSTGD